MWRRIMLFVSGLLIAGVCACAQAVPSLPASERISIGVLPNHVNYHISAVETNKGYAEIALVQRAAADTSLSRAALKSLDHICPESFLVRHDIRPPKEGFVSYRSDARVFRFCSIRTEDKVAMDSLLLMVTDFCRLSDKEQDIIISGDVDKASVIRTLQVLSLTIPALSRDRFPQLPPAERHLDTAGAVASVEFKQPQFSKERMSSVIPLTSRMMALELANLLSRRVDAVFRRADVPCFYRASENGFVLYVADEQRVVAERLFDGILADMRGGGIEAQEFEFAKKAALPVLLESSIKETSSPSVYVDKCIEAFVNGNNLATETTILNFFTKRQISIDRELALIGEFAREVLPSSSATLRRSVALTIPLDSLAKVGENKKLKLRKDVVEPLSGGRLWTFSNGMRVIYKRQALGEEFRYAMVLNGGSASLDSLRLGQAAYLSNLLSLQGVGRVDSDHWKRILENEQISMESKVSLSSITIGGTAPKASLTRSIAALRAFCEDHHEDSDAYGYFRRCEQIRLSRRSPRDAYEKMDSLICPGFTHTSRKLPGVLTDSLALMAQSFFDSRLSNLADGVLLLIGDFDEDKLKKTLCVALKDMPVSELRTPRSRVDYTLRSGHMTLTTASARSGVDLFLTAEAPVSARSYLVSQMALLAVADNLTPALSDYGLSLRLRGNYRIAPAELFHMFLSFSPIAPENLPEGRQGVAGEDMSSVVLQAVKDMASEKISPARMSAYRKYVKARMDAQMKDPQQLAMFIALRYADGKDICLDYEKNIARITDTEVQEAIASLVNGTIVINRRY